MKVLILSLALVVVLHAACSANECLGYNPEVADYAAKYATCSNLLTEKVEKIKNWTYQYCTQAQSKKNIAEVQVVTNGPRNLLAFLAYDTQRKLIVVSFRGSNCGHSLIDNTDTDIDAVQIPFYNSFIGGKCKSAFTNCYVHQGFQLAYRTIREDIRKLTYKLINKYKADKPSLLVTGISLGGALAALASYDLSHYLKHNKIEVPFLFYTFGQPRIGNEDLIKYMNEEIKLFRIVHRADPVPHLATRSMKLGYFYFNPGVQIFFQGEEDSQPQACNGDSLGCSLNRYPLFQVCDHLKYPFINYKASKGCKINVCTINNKIDKEDQTKEFNTALNSIGAFCKQMCKDGHIPQCLTNLPEDARCSPNDHNSFIFAIEDMLSAIETGEDPESNKKESQDKQPKLCQWEMCKTDSRVELEINDIKVPGQKQEDQL